MKLSSYMFEIIPHIFTELHIALKNVITFLYLQLRTNLFTTITFWYSLLYHSLFELRELSTPDPVRYYSWFKAIVYPTFLFSQGLLIIYISDGFTILRIWDWISIVSCDVISIVPCDVIMHEYICNTTKYYPEHCKKV